MKDGISRRDLLVRGLWLAVVGAGGLVSACGDSRKCTDVSSLSAEERVAREALVYLDTSPHGAAKNCENCSLFNASQVENTCGGCQIIAGPIHPKGYCNGWQAIEG